MVVLRGVAVSYERGIPVRCPQATVQWGASQARLARSSSASSLLLSSLELSDTKVYEP